MLNFSKKSTDINWVLIKTEGPTPGKRYGHSMSFVEPYIITFGGFTESGVTNDVWVLSTGGTPFKSTPFKWRKLELKKCPAARAYHTGTLCEYGEHKNSMLVFGGRDINQQAIADSWKLQREESGEWAWTKMPTKGNIEPTPRFQVNYIHIL